MRKDPLSDIDACHSMISDAFSASVLLDEIYWAMVEADEKTPETNRFRHQVHAASIALSAALKPWEDGLGPADAVAHQPQPTKGSAK